MTTTDAGLSVSAVAEVTGVSVHTLRYSERTGLMLSPVPRASSTHRRYTDADVAWTVFLARLRSTGMPISTIRAYVELARVGDATILERLELLRIHRERVLDQLAETQRSLRAVEHKIARYTELLQHPPVVRTSEDEAGNLHDERICS